MANEKTQNFKNHAQIVPLFHFVLSGLILAGFIGSIVNLVHSIGDHQRIYSASLIVVLETVAVLMFWFCRNFPLKAQDRAIRAEENLRHYVLTGKLLDPRITVRQVIGLRFASDDEFVALANRAAEQGLSETDIKKAVKNWRPDYYRV